MPNKNKKGARKEALTDDDFDDMLAELRAADIITPTTRSSTSSSSRSSSSGSRDSSNSTRPRMTVSDQTIIDACRRGDVIQLRRWGQQGVRVTSAVPLYTFAGNGASLDVLRCLVKELGADVYGISTELGDSALYFAAQNGHVAIMRFLVKELGANVNQAESDGSAPLHIAAQQGHVAAVQCLVNELGGDVNHAGPGGITPLHIAAQNGQFAVVQCLVEELGADFKNVDNKGYTLLMTAAPHLDVMRYVVQELGADVDKRNSNGSTPLLVAAQQGDFAVVRCLVKDLGADINQTVYDGATPLMIASYNKHADIVKWLIKEGADLRAEAKWGTAANISKTYGASAEQIAYLEAKEHCSNIGCSGAGLMKCTGCKQARYCGEPCQLAHWKAHKGDCRRWSAECGAGGGKDNASE
jgi:ankyrin repeat protein